MYLDCANLQMVKKMFPLFVSFDILPKRVEMLKKTCLLNKFVIGGPFFMHHPVPLFIYRPKIKKLPPYIHKHYISRVTLSQDYIL
jgi:hypothetical protein